MSNAPLMPMATAVWLVENTTLTFKQIAEFCNLHEVEGLGYRKISKKMNSWGIPTVRGKKWFHNRCFQF